MKEQRIFFSRHLLSKEQIHKMQEAFLNCFNDQFKHYICKLKDVGDHSKNTGSTLKTSLESTEEDMKNLEKERAEFGFNRRRDSILGFMLKTEKRS